MKHTALPTTLRTTLWLAVLLIFAVTTATAQERRARHDFGRGAPEELNLTEDQLAQWRAAHEAHREAIEPLLEQLHDNHDAVEAAIETGDATAVGEAVLAGRALHDQIGAARETLETTVLEILDEEQEAKYLERRRMRHGPMDGPGPGPAFRRHREPEGLE